MTAQTLPESLPLLLADSLEELAQEIDHTHITTDVLDAAAELRRLHARITELDTEKASLRDALSDIASGEIMRSHCTGPHCVEEVGVATADEMASRASGALDWDDRIAQLPTVLREKRQPLSKEQRNQIERDNTIQGYHGDYYDAYGIMDDVEAAHNITGEPA